MTAAEARLDAARAALKQSFGGLDGCECSVIELHIDGNRFAVHFQVDLKEHHRRQQVGAGAATNTGLLHALWELPAGISIPVSCLRDLDLMTLSALGEGYVEGNDVLIRTFAPAGVVTAVVVVANGIDEALARASRLPPIFWRIGAALRPSRAGAGIAAGEASGIGVVVMTDGGADVMVAPRPPVLGVPAVYRWWLGELAYRSWGYGNCAHCVS